MDRPDERPWVAASDPRAQHAPDETDAGPADGTTGGEGGPADNDSGPAVGRDAGAGHDHHLGGAADGVVVARPVEASPDTAPRRPVALAGTMLVGFAMGAADVVPGFSGGTVALVAGIYERLIANVRQGARTMSLMVRGRTAAAARSLAAIEWPFVVALLGGILIAVFTLASTLRRLLEAEPVAMSATFLGLVLGAAAVATRELRRPVVGHGLLVAVAAGAAFVGLGLTPGTFEDPGLLLMFGGGAIAICAMILPGISGSFVLLMVGMYAAVIAAVDDRQVVTLLVFALGCVAGLAAFSTLLNWLLRNYHDLVLSILLGLMLGSVRVLWPWPAEQGVGGTELGPPQGNDWLLAVALAFGAFGVVWTFGLLTAARPRDQAAHARHGRSHRTR